MTRKTSVDLMYKKTKYSHPFLHSRFPNLYDFVYEVILKLCNLKFVLRNLKYISRVKTTNTIINEYEKIINSFVDIRNLEYPLDFAISYKGGLFVYTYLRLKRPNVVLETGVANGYSTGIILEALNKNNHGKLYSVEVNKNVGGLLSKINKSRWILNIDKPQRGLIATLCKLKNIDVFLHDSDHSYENMKFEFNSVIPKLSTCGQIMSDDIEGNSAFIELYSKLYKNNHNVKLTIIPSLRKTFGYITV